MKAGMASIPPDLRLAIRSLLQAESALTLAVTTPEGVPHAAAVFFLPSEDENSLDLYWLSSRSSLHSLAIAAHPQAAITLHRPTFDWQQIAGLQMRGLCSIVEGRERKIQLPRYTKRFHLGTVLSLAIRQSTLYRFRPAWLRFSDNNRGFGWKREFDLAESAAPPASPECGESWT